MKSRKITLLLTEIIIVILILSLASAGCLSVFANASEKTKHSENTRLSAIAAQNAAECWKASGGDIEGTLNNLENSLTGFEFVSSTDKMINYYDGDFSVVINITEKTAHLNCALINIYLKSDEENVFFTVEAYTAARGVNE